MHEEKAGHSRAKVSKSASSPGMLKETPALSFSFKEKTVESQSPTELLPLPADVHAAMPELAGYVLAMVKEGSAAAVAEGAASVQQVAKSSPILARAIAQEIKIHKDSGYPLSVVAAAIGGAAARSTVVSRNWTGVGAEQIRRDLMLASRAAAICFDTVLIGSHVLGESVQHLVDRTAPWLVVGVVAQGIASSCGDDAETIGEAAVISGARAGLASETDPEAQLRDIRSMILIASRTAGGCARTNPNAENDGKYIETFARRAARSATQLAARTFNVPTLLPDLERCADVAARLVAQPSGGMDIASLTQWKRFS
jgi:hypothetical protein